MLWPVTIGPAFSCIAGQYEEALSELDKGAALEPDHPLIKTFRAFVLFYRGEVDAATRIMQQVLERHPQIDGVRPILAIFLSAQGRHREADEQLTKKAKEAGATDHDIAYWLATAYLLAGSAGGSFSLARNAIGLGNENYPWFESDPNWTGVREDPRFIQLMQRIKTGRLASEGQNCMKTFVIGDVHGRCAAIAQFAGDASARRGFR